MSIQDIKSAFRFFVNIAPEYDPAPSMGAVITADGFTGTYAGASLDGFGDEWHSVVSAFEQRHYRGDLFTWGYVWGSVQS